MNGSIGDMETMGRQSDGPKGYTLAPGDVLGQYRIIRPLDRGGMGEVYEAENVVNRKRYALKVLPRAATRGTFVERFRIESRVMSDLRHPHIVQVHHAGEERGLYYLTMDLVVGKGSEPQSLEDRLRESGGRLKEGEARRIALEICDALAYAHAKKVVHRDLKPANVMLDEDGQVRVTDFGLAKVVGSEYLKSVIERSISLSLAGAVSLGEMETQEGPEAKRVSSSARALLGTYDYMAPKQKVGGEVTPRTDIYAFGVMLYRMLTGEKPEGAYKAPSRYGVSKGWDVIVERCLQRNPSDRYASVSDLRRDIERVGRKAVRVVGVVVGLLGIVAVGAAVWWHGAGGRPAVQPQKALEQQRRQEEEAKKKAEEEARKREEEARRQRWARVPEGFRVDEREGVEAQSGLPWAIVHEKTGYRLRLIPAGEFLLGSPEGEGLSAERPQRRIYLDAYWIGETEVTCEQFAMFLNEKGNQKEEGSTWCYVAEDSAVKIESVGGQYRAKSGFGNHPVVEVSWYGARAFAQWMGGDLPMEAQWEKAAKGGREVKWPWGNRWDKTKANTVERLARVDELKTYEEWQKWWERHYRTVIRAKDLEDWSDTTVPVKSYGANGYGMYDMAGNVWEWCLERMRTVS